MKQLLVNIVSQGKVVKTIDLAQQSFKTKAMPNVEYVVVDKATGHAPADIRVKREGTDLVVQGDDASQSLIVQDYYSTEKVALIGENNGQLYAYDIASNPQVPELANLGANPVQPTWWQTGVTSSIAGYSNLAMIGLGVLGVAGIAAAANSNDSNNHHDITPSTPSTPTNHAPTAISLNNATVSENAAGAVIGSLTTTDPDANDTFTYSVSDTRFEVVNGQLKLKDGIALDYETVQNIPVTVTSTDQGGLSTQQTFTINVADVNETPVVQNQAPTAISLDNTTTIEDAYGVIIGNLTTTDPDANDTFTYSVDDARFEVVDGQLKLKDGIALDYEADPIVTLKVTSTDQGGLSTQKTFTLTVQDIPSEVIGDDQNNNLDGTSNDDVIIGLKGNDVLNGGDGDDIYVINKGDGNDIINETDLYNTLIFNGVNSQDISVERYKEDITIHYGTNDSVTFNANTVEEIYFDNTMWSSNAMLDNLGVQYWDRAISHTDVDAIREVDSNNDHIVYYSFPTTNPDPTDTSIVNWAPFTEEQKVLAKNAMATLQTFIPITFIEMPTNTVQPDVIYFQNASDSEPNTLGFASPNGIGGGNVYITSTQINELMQYTVAHELGHVLGLAHPANNGVYGNDPNKFYEISPYEDNDQWTLMTYNYSQDAIAQTYQEMDIATLQYLYGVSPTARTGNDIYTFSNTQGTFVWDGAGDDTIDASTATQSAYIDLHDSSWNYVGTQSLYISDPNQLTINSSTKIENAIGGSANDTLIGNELSNLLQGNAGDDMITGYQGADTIVFKSLALDATGGNGHDTFTDFHLGNTITDNQADKIDLSQLLVGYTGDHSTNSLTSFIQVTQQNGNTVISIDRDGTGTAFTTAELITLTATTVNLDQLVANSQLII